MTPGEEVQVWNRYVGGWTGAFTVVTKAPEGYRIRRQTESTPLPGTFDPDQVRRASPDLSSDECRRRPGSTTSP